MAGVNQISVKFSEDFVYDSDEDILYPDTTTQAIEIALKAPEANDVVLVQDLGYAATNNITLTSPNLINGSLTYVIDLNKALVKLFYNATSETWIATELKGYIIATEDVTLDASTTNVYVDSSVVGIAFTITLNPSPETSSEVYIIDYAGNCGSVNVTIDGNGKDIIGFSEALMNMDFIGYNLTYTGIQYNI